MNRAMHDIPELDRKGLQEFGLVTSGMVVGLFGLLFPWISAVPTPSWPWGVGGALVAWALVAPGTLKPVYRVWMRLSLLLSRITTPIIMGAVFFLVLVPTACVMRLLRHDPMARRFDDKMDSYRIASQKAPHKNMEKPF